MEDTDSLHESPDALEAETVDLHRAYRSLMEEIEAVDWYSQRIDATNDEQLAAILAHNRDEEKEHAAMMLEWIRRRDAQWDEMLREYLFTTDAIEEAEARSSDGGVNGSSADDLGIGNLRIGGGSR